jgi:hypothetical protein
MVAADMWQVIIGLARIHSVLQENGVDVVAGPFLDAI